MKLNSAAWDKIPVRVASNQNPLMYIPELLKAIFPGFTFYFCVDAEMADALSRGWVVVSEGDMKEAVKEWNERTPLEYGLIAKNGALYYHELILMARPIKWDKEKRQAELDAFEEAHEKRFAKHTEKLSKGGVIESEGTSETPMIKRGPGRPPKNK